MKNLTKFFVAVAALFVGVSCTTDTTKDLGQQIVGKGQTVLTVSTGESVIDTKTSLGNKGDKVDGEYPIYWSEGDQLSLNGVASSKLEGVGENATTATFSWEGTFDAPFCVAYPASAEGTVTFAASQKYVEGTFAPKAMPMYGYNDAVGAESVELHYLAGVLRIGLYADEETTIKSMYVENLEGAPIAGTFNCDFANGGVVTPPAEGAVSTISYDAKGVVLSQSEAAPTLFHITVPEGFYEVLRLTIITDKGTMIAKVRAGQDKGKIEAGVVREFATKKFNTSSGETLEIKSQEDLETLRAHIANDTLKNYDIVRVTADFAVEGWTEPIEGFDGMLDGNNHTISGLTAPLFGTLSGTVTNLNLAASISVSNEENVGIVARSMSAGAIVRCNTSGTLTFNGYDGANYAYIGGLVGTAESGATIFECTNGATITATGEYKTRFYFGGIVGQTRAELLHCTNTGTLELNGTMNDRFYYGGIAGSSSSNGGKLDTCKNNGEVKFDGTTTSKGSGNFYMSGVVGISYNDIIDCDNSKKVTLNITSGSGNLCTLGGICGYLGNGCSKMTDCQNDAEINCTYKQNQLYIAGVAGYIASASLAVTNCANNGNLTLGYANKYVGGCFGRVDAAVNYSTWTNIKNSGDITWPNTSSQVPYVGGVLGCGDGTGATGVIKDWHNSGDIYAQATRTSNRSLRTYVGGIAALANASRFSYCSNTGDVIAPYLRNTNDISTWVGLLTGKRYVHTGPTGGSTPTTTYADHCLIKGTIKRYNMDKGDFEECVVASIEDLYKFAFADQGSYEGDLDPTKYITDCYATGDFIPEPSTEE